MKKDTELRGFWDLVLFLVVFFVPKYGKKSPNVTIRG